MEDILHLTDKLRAKKEREGLFACMKPGPISIKPSCISLDVPCSFCGKSFRVRLPYEIFPLEVDSPPVCGACAENIDPVLAKLLDIFYNSEDLQREALRVWGPVTNP